jgi:glycosyltransferase involved in cell wall biosynthesis
MTLDVTPALHLKNEAYWIYYVIRDLAKVFSDIVMLDTGSTDGTPDIAQVTAEKYGATLHLIVEDMGNDAEAIGNCPNRLRETVGTQWMLLVDGDEIWREAQLRALLSTKITEGCTVGMINNRNLAVHGDTLMERDGFAADRLFDPSVRWDLRSDYPFQSHGLETKARIGAIHQLDFNEVFCWHTRHLERSPHDDQAYFRTIKQGYFPYDGPYREIPADWLGEIGPWPNPYLGVE